MRILILNVFIFLCFDCLSQTIEIKKVENHDIIKLLNNIRPFAEDKTDDLLIRVYSLNNEPGSAGFPNGEVTDMIYIAVSEYGEYPDQNLYLAGPFYSPKFVKWDNSNSKYPILLIDYGGYSDKKSISFIIGLDKTITK
jgi:hypothetical protein